MDDDTVIISEYLLSIIIRILGEKKIELTPSKLKAVIHSRRLIPYHEIQNERIFEVMRTSYEQKEGIFYLSQKGQRRFGLKHWRESYEKTALLEAIQGLDEFTISKAREIFKGIVDMKKVNTVNAYLAQLIEDGEIIRVKIGVYRIK